MPKNLYVCRDEIDKDEETEETKETEEIKVVDNNIYFLCDVNKYSIKELIINIKELTKKNQIIGITFGIEPPPINLYINSEGGCLYSALSVVDLISTNIVNINTIISGVCISAATLISLSGHRRYIMENSYMLIHNISSDVSGKMHELEEEMINLSELTNRLKSIYKKNSNITKTQLDKILKTDSLITSKQCLTYGLVDEIKS
jgi:ATP-dependent protease ClpP protease subunit